MSKDGNASGGRADEPLDDARSARLDTRRARIVEPEPRAHALERHLEEVLERLGDEQRGALAELDPDARVAQDPPRLRRRERGVDPLRERDRPRREALTDRERGDPDLPREPRVEPREDVVEVVRERVPQRERIV